MLSEVLFNGNSAVLPLPSKDTLRKHANFLKNHCNIPRGHALQMVAYFYHFSSWKELTSRALDAQDKLALELMNNIRDSVQSYRDMMSSQELLQIRALEATVGTITRAVVDNQLMNLNDQDTIQLYNHLYEELNEDQFTRVTFSNALYSADHCLVLLAKKVAAKGNNKTINPHIYFPWFSFNMYGYLHINGNVLNYECRELDSYLYSSEDDYVALFAKPWFVSYVIGFIRTLLQQLNNSGYTGCISFSRVCNEGLLEQMTYFKGNSLINKRFSLNKNSNSDCVIFELIEAMLNMGAKKNEQKQCLAFNFGNGEVF